MRVLRNRHFGFYNHAKMNKNCIFPLGYPVCLEDKKAQTENFHI